MPGLLRGVARTAVISGTATAVSNRVSRRQAYRWAEQSAEQGGQPQSLPPENYARAGMAPPDTIEQLKELAALRDQGVLTEEEFAAQKAKVLGG